MQTADRIRRQTTSFNKIRLAIRWLLCCGRSRCRSTFFRCTPQRPRPCCAHGPARVGGFLRGRRGLGELGGSIVACSEMKQQPHVSATPLTFWLQRDTMRCNVSIRYNVCKRLTAGSGLDALGADGSDAAAGVAPDCRLASSFTSPAAVPGSFCAASAPLSPSVPAGLSAAAAAAAASSAARRWCFPDPTRVQARRASRIGMGSMP